MELEHALDTRLLGGRRTTTTTTTRVLDGCCVPAGVTLESSSSYALARSLAHPDRAGEPRTRPPTEDTPHIDRNLARSDQQFLSRLRTEGKVTPRRCPPRTTRERETHSPNFREFPSVRWTVATAMPIARSGYALLRFCRERVSRFSSYRFAKHSDCENRCIDRVFVGLLLVKEVGIGNRLDIAVLVGNNIDLKFDFQAKNYMYIFRCNRKVFFKYNFFRNKR